MYKATHGDFDPGEALVRGYHWPAAIADDPYFSFGAQVPVSLGERGLGVKIALTMDADDSGLEIPQTRVVKRGSEDHKVHMFIRLSFFDISLEAIRSGLAQGELCKPAAQHGSVGETRNEAA
eukprot:NODE_21903_length_731_cov_3.354305.p2 GENE.NODE_21903_length_731_cov_3.354305~~NODE_21903_length_731_cov_3.354305.p2  ORF type:complete len:122 (-),score=20.99 NODE_21903_length_731_cov_3.354305:46-411(-)